MTKKPTLPDLPIMPDIDDLLAPIPDEPPSKEAPSTQKPPSIPLPPSIPQGPKGPPASRARCIRFMEAALQCTDYCAWPRGGTDRGHAMHFRHSCYKIRSRARKRLRQDHINKTGDAPEIVESPWDDVSLEVIELPNGKFQVIAYTSTSEALDNEFQIDEPSNELAAAQLYRPQFPNHSKKD